MAPMYPAYQPYPFVNPMMSPQQRLAEMEQQYPQFANQNQMQTQPMGGQPIGQIHPIQNPNSGLMKCRAVTSADEAKASIIDPDGSLHVFVDVGNKAIYTKQINLDGTATLNTYALQTKPAEPVERPAEQIDTMLFVKQEELDAVCRSFSNQIADLEDKLAGYERAFAMMQEEKKPATKAGGKK